MYLDDREGAALCPMTEEDEVFAESFFSDRDKLTSVLIQDLYDFLLELLWASRSVDLDRIKRICSRAEDLRAPLGDSFRDLCYYIDLMQNLHSATKSFPGSAFSKFCSRFYALRRSPGSTNID